MFALCAGHADRMAFQDLMTRSKEDLAKSQARSEAKQRSQDRRMQDLGGKLLDTVGQASAWATAALIGTAEGRVHNKDGTPLSLGPCPLPLAVGTLLTGVSWWVNPGRQVTYAAAGCFGMLGGTTGRGWGAAWRAKAGVEGVAGNNQAIGAGGMTQDTAQMLFGANTVGLDDDEDDDEDED